MHIVLFIFIRTGRDSLAIEAAYRRQRSILEQLSSSDTELNDQQQQQQSVVVFGGLYRLVCENAETPDSPTKTTSTETTTSPSAIGSNAEKILGVSTKDKYVYRLKPIYWEGNIFFRF